MHPDQSLKTLGAIAVNVVETERLILREIETDDAEFMRELMNEPAFIKGVANRGIRTTADAANYITQKIIAHHSQFGFGFCLVVLKDSKAPIGICGLIKREALADVDIGYAFLRKFWGNGYAFEAAAAVLRYGHGVLGLERIVALTAPDNQSSIRLLKKLGMEFQRMIQLSDYGSESKLFA